jgi:hypothetical protein
VSYQPCDPSSIGIISSGVWVGKFYFGVAGMMIVVGIGFVEVLIEAGGNDEVRLECGG